MTVWLGKAVKDYFSLLCLSSQKEIPPLSLLWFTWNNLCVPGLKAVRRPAHICVVCSLATYSLVHSGGTALNGDKCHSLTSCWNWGRAARARSGLPVGCARGTHTWRSRWTECSSFVSVWDWWRWEAFGVSVTRPLFFFFFCLLSAAELRSLPLLVLLPCLTQLLSVLSGQGGCFCQTPSQALQGPAEGHAELLEGSRALPLPPPPTLLSENLALTERCPLPKQGGFKPLLWLLELRDRQGSWIASGCQDSAESTTLREEHPWPRGVWLVFCHPWRSTYLSLGFSCLYVLKSVRDVFPSIAENILSENRAVGYHLQWEDWDRYTSQHNEVWEK